MSEACSSCGHDITMHFASVAGPVRCLVTESGQSTSGVIGLPYHYQCDCIDFTSASGESRRKREQQERSEHEAWVEELRAKIAASSLRSALPARTDPTEGE